MLSINRLPALYFPKRLGFRPGTWHLALLGARPKAIWFDRNGWAIYSKRLERGSFELPSGSHSRGLRDGTSAFLRAW